MDNHRVSLAILKATALYLSPLVCLGFAILCCESTNQPSTTGYVADEPEPLVLQIRPGATRIAELVGNGRIDISAQGDFVYRHDDGQIVENASLANQLDQEHPNTCALSQQVGEQSCTVTDPLDQLLSLRIRHWTGEPLTHDDCRDLGQLVTARSRYARGRRYLIGAVHHIEADGKGCSFRVVREPD